MGIGNREKQKSKRDSSSQDSPSVSEVLEAAYRILPEYSEKLDRIVQHAIAISQQYAAQPGLLHRQLISLSVARWIYEMNALADPIGYWIDKLSAVLEEGRITEVQRAELRLRLTEFEVKYQTAVAVFDKLQYLADI